MPALFLQAQLGEAGLKVVFDNNLSPGQARALVETVLEHHWLDSYALMAEEGCELEAEIEVDSEEQVPPLVPPDLRRHETPCSTAQRVRCCAAS